MKLLFITLIVTTFGKKLQMRNYLRHHGPIKDRIEKSNKIPAHSIDGSFLDRVTFREYMVKRMKIGPVQSVTSRARFSWYFRKYCTVYKQ